MQSIAWKDEDTGDDLYYASAGQHYLQHDEESDALPDTGNRRVKRSGDFLRKTW